MSHWYKPPGRQPLRPIPVDQLVDMIGQPIHLAGLEDRVYTLVDVMHRVNQIVAEINGVRIVAGVKDARYLRKSKK